MYLTPVAVDPFTEQRLGVAKVLKANYNELHRKAYQQVPPRFWASLSVKICVETMLQLSIDSISSGNEDELVAWVKKNSRHGFETNIVQKLILYLKAEILSVCGRVLSAPSPLLGRIRMQFSELESAAGGQVKKSRADLDLVHDPVDILVDRIFLEIDEKDYAPGEHSRQVAHWCFRLATKLGLSEREISMATRGGLIHDIGKIVVPEEILKAPRRLTDEERLIMESHVTAGHDMITSSYPQLLDFAPMVRSHHEKLDGKGYPDKLFRDEIPLLTRIVTVADCYNAMVGRRPYRKAMSPAFAVQQIHEYRGTQFDPDVADAMFELTDEDNRESHHIGNSKIYQV